VHTNYSLTATRAALVLSLSALPALSQDLIDAHRTAKERLLAGVAPTAIAETLARAGFDPSSPNTESVAIYVDQALSGNDREALTDLGVEWGDTWIPPVGDRHPLGFHLARVPYVSMDSVRSHPRVRRIESTEVAATPQDDLGDAMVDLDDLYLGYCNVTANGAGVKVAVMDSGIDLTHPDLPPMVEAFDVTTGMNASQWSTDVSNTALGHGTFVSGLVLGDGSASSGKYRGVVPNADFYFYKIGNDSNGWSSWTDMIKAIDRAAQVGVDVANMSYGGWSTFNDGSSPVCQAVDAAREAGMLFVSSAGNSAADAQHASVSVGAGSTTQPFKLVMDNTDGYYATEVWHWIQTSWREDGLAPFDTQLSCDNLSSGETIWTYSLETSPRGTRARGYWLVTKVPAGTTKTYDLRLTDSTGPSGAAVVHLYIHGGPATFGAADPRYTVGVPALADTAIAVGAWTQRKQWIDASGQSWWYSWLTVDTLAQFSSQGPRIDGTMKPDLVAPGAASISTRDAVFDSTSWALIDDDDVYGAGGAHYFLSYGTSYAAPVVAGVAAALLAVDPSLSANQVASILTSSTAIQGEPDHEVGAGLLDAHAALASLDSNPCPTLAPAYQTASILGDPFAELRTNLGDEYGLDLYILLGSLTGFGPTLVGNGVELPLTVDSYTQFTINYSNEGPLTNTFGALDNEGRAVSKLAVPATLSPSLIGTELHHAVLGLEIVGFGLFATTATESATIALTL
jgi:subtilisin family serine protease